MKAIITITATVEYEIDEKHYPDGLTHEEMLALDVNNANDDPFMLLDGAEIKATGKLCA